MDKTQKRNYGVRTGPVYLLAQLVGLTVCVLILIWNIHYRGGLALSSSNKSKIFNVHPVLMFLGFIFVSSQAILVYRTVPAKKEKQKLVHLTLLGLAIVLGAVGIYAVFKSHNESHIPNLYSLHSWMGIGTISLHGLQWIAGFLFFMFPGAAKSRREMILLWHMFFGMSLYVLAIATSVSGVLEKLTFQQFSGVTKRFGREAMLVNSMGVLIIIHGALVVLSLVVN